MRIQAERNGRQNEKREYRQKEWQAQWKTRIKAERNGRQDGKREYMQKGMLGRRENKNTCKMEW